MSAFSDAYNLLNAAQRRAVDTIDGPLLVIAGPGTGKTQLLSARVANILDKTDTPAANVLCLTFTENGASNMRQRLSRFIGQQAYDVTISTYHAFGSDLIGRYPEYFTETRLQTAIDDLTKRQLLQAIVDQLDYKNPLKQTRHHLGDLMSTISEVKRALLSADELRQIAQDNMRFIEAASVDLAVIFKGVSRMPGSYAKAVPYFEQTLIALTAHLHISPTVKNFEPLAAICLTELKQALSAAETSNKSKPLTEWKNHWLEKNDSNDFIISGGLASHRIDALAGVLEQYQLALESKGMYDFDDMILRSIDALQRHDGLRYSLQERYLYILLDEFQDTNAAQLKLVQLLTDNPLNEGRPNILAVGDDDQAIYAFQGAQYSNMIEFYDSYVDTQVVNLTENYRSHADILLTAKNVAGQIDSRLEQRFEGLQKILHAGNDSIGSSIIERREFQSDVAERDWIAAHIKQLVDSGIAPGEIAVLAPKHRQLEPLIPFLNRLGVPVRYEKRENILDSPIVRQLITMCQLLEALAANNQGLADALWPQVLSYDFWELSTADIWKLSWQIADTSRAAGDPVHNSLKPQPKSWVQVMIDSDNVAVRQSAVIILATASRTATESWETILDYLIGSAVLETGSADGSLTSPLRSYYTSEKIQREQPELFYQTISHLSVLRHRLRQYQDQNENTLLIHDFLKFIQMYADAEQPMIDTSPYSQAEDAVQLMTVFKAKGLEYSHVFLPQCLDDVWGSSSRGNSNKISLPANLHPIRHAGATDDERLRILFVAITRAKQGLYLTSATRNYSGKTSSRLKYFDEQQQPDGTFAALALPSDVQTVRSSTLEVPLLETLQTNWRTRHLDVLPGIDVSVLLGDRTANYQISPTDVLKFIDLEYGGPQRFFFDVILRFPQAPTADSQFGIAIHETLEWYQHQTSERGITPSTSEALESFDTRIKSKKLLDPRLQLEKARGHSALTSYLSQRSHIFQPGDSAEKSFRNENVFCGQAHMAGRIDRLEIDTTNKTIVVVDYKTGKYQSSWKPTLKLHKYALQLYMYKILIEGSKTYAGYKVATGRLEYIEPDENGKCHYLELLFKDDEAERVKHIIQSVYHKIKDNQFPDVSAYQPTIMGVKQYESDLINGLL